MYPALDQALVVQWERLMRREQVKDGLLNESCFSRRARRAFQARDYTPPSGVCLGPWARQQPHRAPLQTGRGFFYWGEARGLIFRADGVPRPPAIPAQYYVARPFRSDPG